MTAAEGWNAFIGNSRPDYPLSVQDHPDFCEECGEELGSKDSDMTCYQCQHPDCEDYPCQDCIETMIDKAHDSYDQER
jgi:hypothetical protein